MNEINNGRKVLISIKVSTLLLIILGIIVVSVIGKTIYKKVSNATLYAEINDNETNEQLAIVEENNENLDSEEGQTREALGRRMNVTSRSAGSRENLFVEENEESKENEEVVEEVEPEIVTTPIEEVTISKNMDLTVRTGLSRDDFILLISGVKEDKSNFFEENAGLIYDLCEKYQLNEIFFCGLISAESGWNIAPNHRRTHNYISLMSNNGLIKFASVEDGLEKAAQTLHDKYLTPGGAFYYGSTLAGMKTRFCPASSTWVNLVYQRMEQILK